MEKNIDFSINTVSSFYIMLDYYSDSNPSGRIICEETSVCQSFFGMTKLIKLINEKVEENCVYSTQSDNLFVKEVKATSEWNRFSQVEEFDFNKKKGHIATFNIKILFNQRKSWQGIIKWLDDNSQLCFRSVLELINLIDNVAVNVINEQCYTK